MTHYRSDFLNIIHERGFIYQSTHAEELDALLTKQSITGYIGFDITANSLHVGSLVQIMLLRWLQKTGHRPLVIMGGATTRIGDPSGKDEARKLLSDDVIDENMRGIRQNLEHYITFGEKETDAILLNNAQWLDGMGYLDFLRDYGSHFTINRMLSFDSVRLRLEREQPLSFLEFNYMILQAYDFLHLHRQYGCVLEMGGADQWGNIINGVDLVHKVDRHQVFGVTTPLITTSTGAKMGKSEKGAIWLSPDRLSPFEFWQFWRNTPDADVGRFLRLYTELPIDEIKRLEALQGAEVNEAKKILADDVTLLAHGEQALQEVRHTAHALFESGNQEVLTALSEIKVDQAALEEGVTLVDLLVESGLAESKSEARRLIRSGGARLNDAAIDDEMKKITLHDFTEDHMLKLSAGKKRHALIKINFE